MQDLNPLEVPKIKIGPRDSTGKPVQASGTLPKTLVRVGNFLLGMLREHYRSPNHKDIGGLKQAEARLRLPRQILEYQKAEYPFNIRFKKNGSAGEWWAKLDTNPDAQPLAVSPKYNRYRINLLQCLHLPPQNLARSLFEILPNSMCDERTASTFNWLNSTRRNKQDASTLVRLTTIRDWYRYKPEVSLFIFISFYFTYLRSIETHRAFSSIRQVHRCDGCPLPRQSSVQYTAHYIGTATKQGRSKTGRGGL